MAAHDEERNETYPTADEEEEERERADRLWEERGEFRSAEIAAENSIFDYPWTVLVAYEDPETGEPDSAAFLYRAPSLDMAVLLARRKLERNFFDGDRYYLFPLEDLHTIFVVPGHNVVHSFGRV